MPRLVLVEKLRLVAAVDDDDLDGSVTRSDAFARNGFERDAKGRHFAVIMAPRSSESSLSSVGADYGLRLDQTEA